MTASQFITKWNGGRVDYDGVYAYQCVDLIKQYLHEVHGMRPQAWGNAIDYWTKTNPEILKKFDKVQGTPQVGDIIVYGYPYGVFNGITYGHIALAVNSTTMQEQNGGSGDGSGTGTNAIRKRSILSKRLGLLRPKGSSMAKDTTIKQVFHTMLSREPDAGAYSTYRNTSDYVLVDSVYRSPERASKLKSTGVSGYNWVARISSLMKAVAARDVKITELNGKVGALNGTIAGKNKELEAFDKELTLTKNQLADANVAVTEAQNAQVEAEKALAECQEQAPCPKPEGIGEKIACAIKCFTKG